MTVRAVGESIGDIARRVAEELRWVDELVQGAPLTVERADLLVLINAALERDTLPTLDALKTEEIAAAARADERGACAQIARQWGENKSAEELWWNEHVGHAIAAAIEARGKP